MIGRAIRLVLLNLLDARPGGIDRSTLGHPGKISYCVAEDEEGSPWLALAEERGVPPGASAVTVLAAGAPRQLMNEWTTAPEEILDTYASEIRANMRHYSIWPGNYARDRSAAAARAPERAGWSKTDIASSSKGARACAAANGPRAARAVGGRERGGSEYVAFVARGRAGGRRRRPGGRLRRGDPALAGATRAAR